MNEVAVRAVMEDVVCEGTSTQRAMTNAAVDSKTGCDLHRYSPFSGWVLQWVDSKLNRNTKTSEFAASFRVPSRVHRD